MGIILVTYSLILSFNMESYIKPVSIKLESISFYLLPDLMDGLPPRQPRFQDGGGHSRADEREGSLGQMQV